MFSLIKDLVSGLAAFFRIKEKKLDLDNSPEMQANAKAQQRAEVKQDATNAVASDDLEKIRKLAGE